MASRRTRVVAVAAASLAISMVLVASGPAQALGTTISDPSGVDWTPGCATWLPPPSANSVASPGGTACASAVYDGSTEGLDLHDDGTTAAVALSSDGNGHLVASWTVDGAVPAAGNTTPPPIGYDLPHANFLGGTYFALYVNATKQTSVEYDACTRAVTAPPGGLTMYQRWGTWRDGFQFFVAYSVTFVGTSWRHRAYVGEYVPGPTSGFRFFDLGTDTGSGWVAANANHAYNAATPAASEWKVTITGTTPTTITVTAPSHYKRPDTTNCVEGYFNYRMTDAGDVIRDVKGLTTAVSMPMAASNPPSHTCHANEGTDCSVEVTPVTNFTFVDTTSGTSVSGSGNTNITNIAYSFGANATANDTDGPGQDCATSTNGGTSPQNPLWWPDSQCHIDDDPVSRGSTRPEWWESLSGFTI